MENRRCVGCNQLALLWSEPPWKKRCYPCYTANRTFDTGNHLGVHEGGVTKKVQKTTPGAGPSCVKAAAATEYPPEVMEEERQIEAEILRRWPGAAAAMEMGGFQNTRLKLTHDIMSERQAVGKGNGIHDFMFEGSSS